MTRLAQVEPAGAGPLTAETEAASGWTAGRWAAIAALVAAGVFATRDAWSDILAIAMADEEASHIFLVPIVAAWIAWSRRELAIHTEPRRSVLGPLLIVAGGLINWYGFNHLTQAAWHGGGVLIAVGCFVTVAGWRIVWALWPAFLVLAFLVPVPGMIRQEIAIPLQEVSAKATEILYQAFAFDIERHGNVLHFRGQDIAIAEACNGMRMVFALFLVTYAVAFTTPLRGYVQAALLVCSPLLAVVCNIIRLAPTVWVYGYHGDAAGKVFHDLNGWLMIGVAFVLVMGLIRLLRWLELPVMRPGYGDEGGAP